MGTKHCKAGRCEDQLQIVCSASLVGLTLPEVLLGPAGLVLSISSACMSLWTMFMLIALYVERKQRLVSLHNRTSVQPGLCAEPTLSLPCVLPPLGCLWLVGWLDTDGEPGWQTLWR